jgi:hypothetical protein
LTLLVNGIARLLVARASRGTRGPSAGGQAASGMTSVVDVATGA